MLITTASCRYSLLVFCRAIYVVDRNVSRNLRYKLWFITLSALHIVNCHAIYAVILTSTKYPSEKQRKIA